MQHLVQPDSIGTISELHLQAQRLTASTDLDQDAAVARLEGGAVRLADVEPVSGLGLAVLDEYSAHAQYISLRASVKGQKRSGSDEG